jgi:alanine racemase
MAHPTRCFSDENLGAQDIGFLDVRDLIAVVKPTLVKGIREGNVSGIAIDTRRPIGDDHVFWAISGRHFDGNDFALEALDRGAKAAVVSRPELLEHPLAGGKALILVTDTLEALQTLAWAHRNRVSCPVVGITGSNGKTLVKEMLASILCLDRRTYRSPLSYNTQVGAALALLGIRPEHDIALIEAGISLPGEMDRLEAMIQPSHGILTVISKAHIGGLKTLENTLEQKARLFKHLTRESFLVLNADDPLSTSLAGRAPCRVITFGLSSHAHVRAEKLVSVPERGFRFRLSYGDKSFKVSLPVPGKFNVLNAAAAAAAALALGVPMETVRKGLADFRPSPMRLEFHTTDMGVTLINDTYNSDPASMKGALDVLAKVGKGSRKIAILSEMLDLGLHSQEEHQAVGTHVVKAGVDQLITVGANAELIGRAAAQKGMDPQRIVNTAGYNEAAAELEKVMNRGDVVLFKGSRWFRLERIARQLVGSIGPTRLVVDLDAIAANIKTIRGLVGDKVPIMAVVKSFGYGNDSIRTSKVALENGVNHLAVAFADEGATLRANRIDVPILVFNVFPDELDKIVRYGLSATVPSMEVAQALNEAGAEANIRIPVHVKIDTGMGRSGFWVDDAGDIIHRLCTMPNLDVEGLMTHFSSADDPESDDYTRHQINSFRTLVKEMEQRGIGFRYIHAGNSAAIARFPETHLTMVRPGLGIYGMYPSDAVRQLVPLEQVITFSTKISQIKEHPPGRCISYNRKFVTCRPCRIATLPVGYNDGYPRFQSNKGEVLVRGKRAPVVGTVCMDMTMIDVTDIPGARVGDEVVLIGKQGNDEILADDIAANGNTINYEIACKISPRVKRIFVQS